MNSNVNYSFVGAAVLVLAAAMVAFVYWMLQPGEEKLVKPYMIRFTESVSGLNIDSPVKFRGITVGKVTEMRINPKNSEEIEIFVAIQATTPIKTNTVAKLTSQGITGLSYIDLSQGSKDAPKLKPKKGEEMAVIPSIPSLFERFEKSMGTVSSRLSKTLLRAENLLNDENQVEIGRILEQSALALERINRLLDDKSIGHFHNLMANADTFSRQMTTAMPKVDALIDNTMVWEDSIKGSFASIMGSYKQIEGSMVRFRQSVDEGDINIKEIAGTSLANMDRTMVEMQTVLIRMEQLIERLERSPGDMLFKREAIQPGPGE